LKLKKLEKNKQNSGSKKKRRKELLKEISLVIQNYNKHMVPHRKKLQGNYGKLQNYIVERC
jgi:hypothetical protein